MMEFGALQCVFRNPDCGHCPLKDSCVAHDRNLVSQLPVKTKRIKVRDRYFDYFFIIEIESAHTYLSKRTSKDIWRHLYEFPMMESATLRAEQDVIDSVEWELLFRDITPVIVSVSNTYRHILSHQRLHARFWMMEVAEELTHLMKECLKIPIQTIDDHAVPRLMERYLHDNKLLDDR